MGRARRLSKARSEHFLKILLQVKLGYVHVEVKTVTFRFSAKTGLITAANPNFARDEKGTKQA